MTDTIQEHSGELDALRTKVAQLEQALSSRIVIEQAKGVLGERYRLSVEDAFHLLRRSARNARTNLHQLAERVVTEKQTPADIVATLERDRPPR